MSGYEQLETNGLPVFYPSGQLEAAGVLAVAASETAAVVRRQWGLSIPAGCRIYVLTDWEGFLDHATPRRLRLLVRLTKPLWRRRVERTFDLAGGWLVAWRGRPAVGVKPVSGLEKVDQTLGDRLFEPVADLTEKMRHLACHELTHACTAHLRLPVWLNEGLAMRAVDHLVGRRTVREETRALVHADPSEVDGRAYRRLKSGDHDALIRLYATGYWTTCQLEERAPDLLRHLLNQRRRPKEVTREVRSVLGLASAWGGGS